MPRSKRTTGSQSEDRLPFLAAGQIRRPHGLMGEVLVEIFTDFPERLRPKKVVYVGEDHIPLTIRTSRPHGQRLLLAFKGIGTPEEVGRYRNQVLYVNSAHRVALPAGEYYQDELLGMQVVDESSRLLGELAEIMQTGANDVYVVSGMNGRELLLPATSEVILHVDLPQRTIQVHLLPGLVDEEYPSS
jgi:16S rRNA processing protein RimM